MKNQNPSRPFILEDYGDKIDNLILSFLKKDEKEKREVINRRKNMTISIPKNSPAVIKPLGPAFLIFILRVNQKVYIVPEDYVSLIENSEYGKYLRRRWVCFAATCGSLINKKGEPTCFGAKEKDIDLKIRVLELLPSVFKEMINIYNKECKAAFQIKFSSNSKNVEFRYNFLPFCLSKSKIKGSNSMSYDIHREYEEKEYYKVMTLNQKKDLVKRIDFLSKSSENYHFQRIVDNLHLKFQVNRPNNYSTHFLRSLYFNDHNKEILERFIHEHIHNKSRNNAAIGAPLIY